MWLRRLLTFTLNDKFCLLTQEMGGDGALTFSKAESADRGIQEPSRFASICFVSGRSAPHVFSERALRRGGGASPLPSCVEIVPGPRRTSCRSEREAPRSTRYNLWSLCEHPFLPNRLICHLSLPFVYFLSVSVAPSCARDSTRLSLPLTS